MVAIELHFSVFEPTIVDFWVIFKLELHIYCWMADIFDFHVFFFNVIDWHIKVEL